MKAKFVRESYDFKRGGDVSYPRMGIGKSRNSKLRQALMQALSDADMIDAKGVAEWYEENPILKNAIQFDPSKDNPTKDIIGFDEDFYSETYDYDLDELQEEFKSVGKFIPGKNGEIGVEEGILPDGSKVFYYKR